MGTIWGALEECGYHDRAYRVLDAQHFGVPQRRRRVFIAGHLGSTPGWAGEVLALISGGEWDSESGHTSGETITRTFEPSVA